MMEIQKCSEDGKSTRCEFGVGPGSETGSRSRRESEGVKGRVVKSGRGRSEAVARKQSGRQAVNVLDVACPRLGQESEFIYMYSTCSERGRGSRVSAAGDRPRGVVTMKGDVPRGELNAK